LRISIIGEAVSADDSELVMGAAITGRLASVAHCSARNAHLLNTGVLLAYRDHAQSVY